MSEVVELHCPSCGASKDEDLTILPGNDPFRSRHGGYYNTKAQVVCGKCYTVFDLFDFAD